MDQVALILSVISCLAAISVAFVPLRFGKILVLSTIIIWGVILSVMIVTRITDEYSYRYTNCTYATQVIASFAIWFASVAFIVCYDNRAKKQNPRKKWRG